ncbi:condensin complex subunit 1 [[Candida] anglica]|uniref:Condensin complex subunit 1 n=1 Tax=[Candida] anglica TaxID=148631 RepID=A0ABP0EDZ9_9ASCO
MDFNLLTYFNAFDAEKEYTADFSDIEAKLESVTETLAHNPESIYHNHEIFEEILELCQGFKSLEAKHQKQLAYLVATSFNSINHVALTTLDAGDYVESIESIKRSLERYGYLIYVLLIFLGKEDYTGGSRSRQSSTSANQNPKWKSNCTQIENCLESISNTLKIDLSKIFITTPERDLYLELFIRPIFHMMEIPERMKHPGIKMYMFKIIAMSVKNHGHASSVENLILQSLTYYVHLPHYMAELLHIISNSYDYSVLTEEVLREISQIEFNANDSNGPKSIAEFLIKLSELSPRLILKQMSSVALLLDNSNMTLRCSVVETCGNIVVDIIKHDSGSGSGDVETDEHGNNANGSQQINGLLDLLEERFLDQNPYVRTKAIQALTKLCTLQDKFTTRRQKFMSLAVRSLGDKSTLVRRNSVKLMSKIVLTHPFSSIHGTQLGYNKWRKRLDDSETELKELLPTKEDSPVPSGDEMALDDISENEDEDEDMEDVNENEVSDKEVEVEDEDRDEEDDEEDEEDDDEESGNKPNQNIPDINSFYKLRLTIKYYQDAIDFIEEVEEGVKVVSQLLFSKNRNEVLESMDFLVLTDAYEIRGSSDGIRRMLHLVWMKGSSDEGKSIASHLIDCYKSLFLTAPTTLSRVQQAAFIAKNLMELTSAASVADLASLEKLLCLMHEGGLIAPDVIQVLWQIYNFTATDECSIEDTKRQCRQAIIILGMLALADSEIVIKGLDSLLNVGLGERGLKDLILAKYTCIAIQRVVPLNSKSGPEARIVREADAIAKLKQTLLTYSENPEWYSIAEQAIGAIYQVSSEPDQVGSDIIKEKSILAFQRNDAEPNQSRVVSLSQLLFIVGHIAIKTIVYLERLEAQFKKKKHDAETNKNKDSNNEEEEGNELEMIGGTSEDDFTDAVIFIKERQLLYGEDALLSKFGPLVKEICSNNKLYDNEGLQRAAVLCLAKLMCVSSAYCEENLPLLITIMEKSPDPIIRCNCVLGLGDMAVCFNNLVDENTDFLYRRLADENIMVQRTCLMTVTFLILAGQVKVKGQLSSMAKCLENPDQGISDMCRLFFTELATKDNAIYNGFIDIFSGLSNDETLSKDSMKRIVKFLVGFIEKEKHQKQLAEKLLARLIKCQDELQWNDIAYVLNAIPYKSEDITQALEGGFKMVSARQ